MYLGIDLGTSEVKVVLLDGQGHLAAVAGETLSVSRPQPGWSEQDPQAWWDATCTAIARLRDKAGAAFAEVRAIGLSGQMHGAVLLDADDRVLRPAILWNDLRSVAECEALTRAAPSLRQVAGNLAMPGFTAVTNRSGAQKSTSSCERLSSETTALELVTLSPTLTPMPLRKNVRLKN